MGLVTETSSPVPVNPDFCLHCVGVARVTGRAFEECPGHKSSEEIAELSTRPVNPVTVSMVLHISNRPKAVIAEKVGCTQFTVGAIMKASAKWHRCHAFD